MTRITNNEQILAIVRSQLRRMAKQGKTARSSRAALSGAQMLSSREKVEALTGIEDMTERELAEGFVRLVLAEEFGEELSATPAFQRVVERTAKLLGEDGELAGILERK